MTTARLLLPALFAALLCVPAGAGDIAADKIVPRAGMTIAPLPTDAAVRNGMLAIRDIVRTNHSLVTHRRMPPDHAQRFAAQVKIEADRILAKTSLSGDALEKLRALLAEVVSGLGAVAKAEEGTTALDGLARADAALARYPAEFDDPTWKPLQAVE